MDGLGAAQSRSPTEARNGKLAWTVFGVRSAVEVKVGSHPALTTWRSAFPPSVGAGLWSGLRHELPLLCLQEHDLQFGASQRRTTQIRIQAPRGARQSPRPAHWAEVLGSRESERRLATEGGNVRLRLLARRRRPAKDAPLCRAAIEADVPADRLRRVARRLIGIATPGRRPRRTTSPRRRRPLSCPPPWLVPASAE